MAQASPGSAQGYRIGEAARLSGVDAANIRFYEAKSLLSPRGRSMNSYRFYSESDIHQLRFIRLCRAMDMSLDEVRTLLSLDLRRKADCAAADRSLSDHLGHVRERLAELRALEKQLAALQARCQGGGDRCHIIEALHQQADAQPPGLRPAAPAKRHV